MARYNIDNPNRPETSKKQVNWLLIANIVLTLGLYVLHFTGH